MTTPTTKEALLARIASERRQLERYLFYFARNAQGMFVPSERLKFSDEELTRPGVVGDWSIKDVLAHITDNERRLVKWLRLNSRRTPFPDPASADLSASLRRRSPKSVLAGFRGSHIQLVEALQTTSAKDAQTHLDDIAASTYARYAWAKQAIRRWRNSRAGPRTIR
jgi:hypothetical protein